MGFQLKIAGVANVSVELFPHNMIGNIDLNTDTTNNHLVPGMG